MKKKKSLLMLLIIVLSLTFIGGEVRPVTVQASGITTKSARAKIKSLKSEIKKLTKKYNSQVAKENKQKAGTKAIAGTIISRNPLIVQDYFGSCYWINKPENFSMFITVGSGYVKLNGTYREYNGRYTCAVCTAVKVSNASAKTKSKIDEKQKEVQAYNSLLQDKVTFHEESISYVEGLKNIEIEYYMSTLSMKYNKVSWKSSDPDIVSVTSKGKITTKKPGTATITAQTSIGKKKSKLKICVLPASEVIEIGNGSFTLEEKDTGYIRFSSDIYEFKDMITLESTDPSVIDSCELDSEDNEITFISRSAGVADLNIYINGRLAKSVTITVTPQNQDDTEDEYDDDWA